MSLYKRDGSPFWVSELQVNGQRYRRSTKTTSKREAAVFEARWRLQLLAGNPPEHPAPPQKPQVRIPTLGEAVQAYYREVLEPRQHRARSGEATRCTLSLLPKHFGPEITLDQLSSLLISEWRAAMLANGLKPASVNRQRQSTLL